MYDERGKLKYRFPFLINNKSLISKLKLPWSVQKRLLHLEDWEQLGELHDADLLKRKNFGWKSFETLIRTLEELKISLNPELHKLEISYKELLKKNLTLEKENRELQTHIFNQKEKFAKAVDALKKYL